MGVHKFFYYKMKKIKLYLHVKLEFPKKGFYEPAFLDDEIAFTADPTVMPFNYLVTGLSYAYNEFMINASEETKKNICMFL